MPKVNRGKKFEDIIQEGFENLEDTYILRLYDTTNGYIGVSNPCDYVVYKHPNMFLIECKSCHGASFSVPDKNIEKPTSLDNQRTKLCAASEFDGIFAGFIIWFIDKDRTLYIDAHELEDYLLKANRKSIPWDADIGIEIKGRKKRVFFDYDLQDLLDLVVKR